MCAASVVAMAQATTAAAKVIRTEIGPDTYADVTFEPPGGWQEEQVGQIVTYGLPMESGECSIALVKPGPMRRGISLSAHHDDMWTNALNRPGVSIVTRGKRSSDINESQTEWIFSALEVLAEGRLETWGMLAAAQFGVLQPVVYVCTDLGVNSREWPGVEQALVSIRVDLSRRMDQTDKGSVGNGFNMRCIRYDCPAIGISGFSSDCLAMCRN